MTGHEKRRSLFIRARVNKEEKNLFLQIAKSEGLDESKMIRKIIMEYARKRRIKNE